MISWKSRHNRSPQPIRASRRETRRVFVVILLIFVAFFRWLPGGDPLDPTTGVRGFIEIGGLGVATILVLLWWPRQFWLSLSKVWWLLLPAFWAGLSALWSPYPLLTLAKALELALITLLAAAISRTALSFWQLLRLIQKALLLLIVFGLALNVLYYGTPFYFSISLGEGGALEGGRLRLTLGRDHPLVVGHMFALLMVSSGALLLRKLTLSSVVAVMMGIVGTVATDARASMVLAPTSLLWAFLLVIREKLGRLGWILHGVLVIGFLATIPWLLSERLDPVSVYAPDVETLNGRLPLWIAVLERLVSDPMLLLMGTGFAATRFVTYELAWWNPGHTHNGYLEVLTGLGAIGVILYVPTFFLLIKALFYPFAAGFSAYLLGMAFFNPLFNPDFVLFCALALILAARREGWCRPRGNECL